MRYDIEYACLDDAEKIAELEKDCFSLPMTHSQILSLLSSGSIFLLAKWYKNAEASPSVLGYIGMQIVLDEGYILNFAVSEEYRKMGIGDSLLSAMEQEGFARALSFISLEVRESNTPAVSLYRKHGFQLAGKRTNYYSKPRENALIYTKYLQAEK